MKKRGRTPLLSSASAAVFLDTSVLGGQTLEVCQLSSSDLTATNHFDLLDDRGMNRECSLDTDTAGDLAYSEGCTDSAVGTVNADALEYLDTGLLTFSDTDIDLQCVTDFEIGNVCTELFFCDFVD